MSENDVDVDEEGEEDEIRAEGGGEGGYFLDDDDDEGEDDEEEEEHVGEDEDDDDDERNREEDLMRADAFRLNPELSWEMAQAVAFRYAKKRTLRDVALIARAELRNIGLVEGMLVSGFAREGEPFEAGEEAVVWWMTLVVRQLEAASSVSLQGQETDEFMYRFRIIGQQSVRRRGR